MTGGVPEDDIALRVLQVFVQAPPLLLSTANHSFTDDVHGEHVPQRAQAAPSRLLKMQLKWHWLRVGVVYEFKALPTLPVWQPAVIQAVTPINLGNLMRS